MLFRSKPGAGDYYLLSACSTAVGNNANATSGGTAIGDRAKSEGGVAIGVGATSLGNSGTAIGPAALASGNTAIAMGRQLAGVGDYAIALGNVAYAKSESTVAVGHSAFAEGYRSIAIGSSDSQNAGNDGVSAGANYNTVSQTHATGAGSVALGGGATTAAANSVALGSESVGAANAAGSEKFSGTAIAAGGAVSVGKAGAERQIKNVAGGTLDTDAVNVRQLTAVNGKIDINTSSITNLGTRVDTAEGDISTLQGTVTNHATSISALEDDALLWDPAAGSGAGAYSANHGDTGPNKITNVAEGTLAAGSTDAVNDSQLYATNQSILNLGDVVEANKTHYYSVNNNDPAGANYGREIGRASCRERV